MVVHLLISQSFNFSFVYGKPNWMDDLWGLTGKTAWDGGFFGIIGWAMPMLFGTLAYDVVTTRTPWESTVASPRAGSAPDAHRLCHQLPGDAVRHGQG